jgi:magnesium transporter
MDVVAGEVRTIHIDILIAQQFIVTLHRGPVDSIDLIRRTYQKDFEKFAKTLSFLLYEVFDHLIDGYRRGIRALEHDVERLQSRMFVEGADVFAEAGRVTRSLLTFRAVLVAARDVLHELATRRSSFVSDSCQPYLANLTGTLDRLGQDLAVEREVLSELVTISMGVLSQRTNHVVNRLTALSIIFLPLSFLAGVYGMNFDVLPGRQWEHSFWSFWLVCLVTALGLLAFMRWRRWV